MVLLMVTFPFFSLEPEVSCYPRYVPGRGRGATGFIGGVSRDEAAAMVGLD